MKQKKYIISAILLVSLILAAGCGSNIVKISRIMQNTDQYANKTVEVAGVVTRSYGVDLVLTEAGAYQVDDGTGKIWVTSSAGEPADGTKVWVKGKVAKGFRLMGQTFGAVIHESERKTK